MLFSVNKASFVAKLSEGTYSSPFIRQSYSNPGFALVGVCKSFLTMFTAKVTIFLVMVVTEFVELSGLKTESSQFFAKVLI